MALDPNIILQSRAPASPLESQGRVLKLRQLQQATDEADRGIADRETVANLYRNNVDASGNINAASITQGLAKAGMGDQIPRFQTDQANYGKAVAGMNAQQVEFHKKQLDAVNGSLAALLAKPNVTHDDVIQQISALVDNQIIDNAAGAAMVKQLPGPEQLRPWLTQKAIEGLDQSKRLELMLPKYDEQDTGGAINQGTINQLTGVRTPGVSVPKTATPGEKLTADAKATAAARTSFTPDESSLMAALAENGVAIPAGLRSREQMKSTFQGLLARNPNLSPDDIAQKIATGQINFGAEKKETTVAAGQAGKVAVAVNELKTFGDQVLDASKDLPRGAFVPWNRLSQMTDAQISDPRLIRFKAKMQALNNAFDQISARGGMNAEKMNHIRGLFNTAVDGTGVQAMVQALKEEAAGAQDAARQATHRQAPASADSFDVPPDIAAIMKQNGIK